MGQGPGKSKETAQNRWLAEPSLVMTALYLRTLRTLHTDTQLIIIIAIIAIIDTIYVSSYYYYLHTLPLTPTTALSTVRGNAYSFLHIKIKDKNKRFLKRGLTHEKKRERNPLNSIYHLRFPPKRACLSIYVYQHLFTCLQTLFPEPTPDRDIDLTMNLFLLIFFSLHPNSFFLSFFVLSLSLSL